MVTVRWSQGKDINAACGQLYADNEKKTVRNPIAVSE
jgi:adenine C2-methylase RlmN of 23S rRNA A2503 and tRNA A37